MNEWDIGKKLLIIGAGGLGREVKWLIERINIENRKINLKNMWQLAGFIDDGIETGTLIDGIPVIGNIASLLLYEEPVFVVCSIANPHIRKRIIQELATSSYLHFPNFIDPSAIVSKDLNMGRGNIVCAGCVLTINISFQDFNIINPGCTIGHDTVIRNLITIYPGANIAGNITIKNQSQLGIGCRIIQGITIGPETIIGAGAVVIRDLPGKCTVVGNPAKVIKSW